MVLKTGLEALRGYNTLLNELRCPSQLTGVGQNNENTTHTVHTFVTDAPSKRTPAICPLSKSDKSPIFRFFHTDSHST
jgi:hypothetical protein